MLRQKHKANALRGYYDKDMCLDPVTVKTTQEVAGHNTGAIFAHPCEEAVLACLNN